MKALLLIPVFVLIWLALLVGFDMRHPLVCKEYDFIKQVGGCTEFAKCAVMTVKGVKLKADYPVAGEKICIKLERDNE